MDNLNDAISKIEAARKSKVIVYITGDRKMITPQQQPMGPNLTTIVHPEVIPFFDEILRKFPASGKVTLIIYTNGGDISAPWPLVNLIREYCSSLEVIVLKKSLSAGTLIALGADKIFMPRGSFLSPVDPARLLKGKDNELKNLEIEDIIGYIDFAKDKVGINDQATLGEVLKELNKEIDPSTIGSINRTHSLIRRLAVKLLRVHEEKLPEHQEKELVEQLTKKLFSHTHLISRREAEEIGMRGLVEPLSSADEKLIDKLYMQYKQLMKLEDPLNPEKIVIEKAADVQSESGYNEECITAVIHAVGVKYNNEVGVNIKGITTPNGQQQNNVSLNFLGWRKELV